MSKNDAFNYFMSSVTFPQRSHILRTPSFLRQVTVFIEVALSKTYLVFTQSANLYLLFVFKQKTKKNSKYFFLMPFDMFSGKANQGTPRLLIAVSYQ